MDGGSFKLTRIGALADIEGNVKVDAKRMNTLGFNLVLRACSRFWLDGENELKFAPMRRKKRSVAALHEHFCNEIGADFGHL